MNWLRDLFFRRRITTVLDEALHQAFLDCIEAADAAERWEAQRKMLVVRIRRLERELKLARNAELEMPND
jgi:hypothetical protein